MFNRSDLSACVVIQPQESDSRDVVFQPGIQPNLPRYGGQYRVEMSQTVAQFGQDAFMILNETCKVRCPDPTGSFESCVPGQSATAGQCCLEQPEPNEERPLCDLLVFQPRVRMTGLSGDIIIQYLPLGMSEQPVNITMTFSK